MGLLVEELRVTYNSKSETEVEKVTAIIETKKKEGFVVTENVGSEICAVKLSKANMF